MNATIDPGSGRSRSSKMASKPGNAAKGNSSIGSNRKQTDTFADTLASSKADEKNPVADDDTTNGSEQANEQEAASAFDAALATILSALKQLEGSAVEKQGGSKTELGRPDAAKLGQRWLDALVGGDVGRARDEGEDSAGVRRKNLPAPRTNGDRAGDFFRRAADQLRLESLSETKIARSDVERVEVAGPRRETLSSPLLHHLGISEQASRPEKGQKVRPKPVSAADLARELQLSRGERGTSARAVLDVGRGREVALKLRQHQGIMTVDIEASANELSQKLIHHVQELTRSLQTLDVGRGRVQIDGATVGEWSESDKQRDDELRQVHDRRERQRAGDEEHDEDARITVIRHAAMTGQLHIVT
jgi:hypothetical protein